MSSALNTLLAFFFAYLLGSIPFALVSSRLFGLADPRSYGSGNPGATNVLRSGHKGAAVCTLLGDAGKGWLAVFLVQACGPSYGLAASAVGLVMLAVFLGHVHSVFLRFKGGKGVATAVGILLALDLGLGLTTLAIWLAIAWALRYSSLAALIAAAVAPFYAAALWGGDATVIAVGAMSCLLIGKHWQNIQRLIAGTEPKIGAKKTIEKA
jgi:glycerol-3-phosphate acyltransferase PlsY